MDLGSTRVTSITVPAYEMLKKHFGIEEENIITDRMQQTVRVNEKILTALDIDTRLVIINRPDVSTDTTLPDGSWQDEWSVVRRKPPGSHYYDLLKSPLAGEPTSKDLEEYPWPDPDDAGRYRGLREYARRLREETDYAVVGHMSGGWIHTSQYLRGFEGWYVDLIERPAFIGELMERVMNINLRMAGRFLDEVGDYLDVVATGDDIGAQNGPMVSPKLYKDIIWPLQKRQFSFVRERTKAKIFYHTCGSVYRLLPDIIDLGIDILNPVQVSAAEMGDTKRLKSEFGKHLSFWGGVDTFRVMPKGTPDEVRAEAGRRIRELGEGGGYVLNTVHNIQPDVPVENILALYEFGRKFRL